MSNHVSASPSVASGAVDVAVVGGGLAGLAAALRLRSAGRLVRVFEATEAPGGVAQSRRIDGFLFEGGPNTVPASARHVAALAGELGLGARTLTSAPGAAVRWLWFGGRLRRVPHSLPSFLATPLLSARAKLAVASEPLRRRRPVRDGEPEPTLGALLAERFGAEAAELFGGALVRGTSGGDVQRLGAWGAFPILEELVAHGGIVRGLLARKRGAPRGPRGLVSFPDGFGEIASAARAELGDDLVTRARVDALRREGDEYLLVLHGGAIVRARAVVLAVGARGAASLLAPLGADLAVRTLTSIPHAGLRVVHLGFAPAIALPPGFGYLVPTRAALDRRGGHGARPQALGALFPANLFPRRAPGGSSSVTMFFDDEWARGADEATRIDLATADLALTLRTGPLPRPAAAWCVDWPGRLPQFEPGHAARISAAEAELARTAPGIALAGGYTRGASVDRVIERGREVADRLLEGRAP